VQYLDEEGDVVRKWHLEGGLDIQTIVGMLEMFKLRMTADTYDWDDAT
jgi:hypothetical protein